MPHFEIFLSAIGAGVQRNSVLAASRWSSRLRFEELASIPHPGLHPRSKAVEVEPCPSLLAKTQGNGARNDVGRLPELGKRRLRAGLVRIPFRLGVERRL